jgi:hypothetical protein
MSTIESVEKRLIPHADEQYQHAVCIGVSMMPLLKANDILEYQTCTYEQVKVGDVLVCQHPDIKADIFSHRVIKKTGAGIFLRGDNNNRIDRFIILPEHIVGVAIAHYRKEDRQAIYRGYLGILQRTVFRSYFHTRQGCGFLLRSLYHYLVAKGWLQKIMQVTGMTPEFKVLIINRKTGLVKHLMLNKKRVGEWSGKETGWVIKKPYLLIVPEKFNDSMKQEDISNVS